MRKKERKKERPQERRKERKKESKKGEVEKFEEQHMKMAEETFCNEVQSKQKGRTTSIILIGKESICMKTLLARTHTFTHAHCTHAHTRAHQPHIHTHTNTSEDAPQ